MISGPHVDPPRGDQPQELLHVAVLGPAHVRQRIVAPLLLVRRVVTSGTVGARHVELNFLQVHVVPGELHAHRAHDTDAAAVAAEAQRVLRRRRRFRGRRHNRAIHAAPVGKAAHPFQRRRSCNPVIRAQPARQVHAPRVQVDAHHHAALQPHQLRHQLTHQAQPDHRHHVAQFDARRAHRVHRDAAQRGEAGVLARHPFGHPRRQVASHQDRLAVPRAFAAVRHALADLEIGHRGVPRRHHAGAGVSQHGILGEFRAHFRERRGRPGFHRHIPDLAQVRRIVGHLREQAVAMDAGRLGSARNQRIERPYQYVVG